MNNNNFNRDELYHYGVKGMKWGVHRSRNSGGSTGQKRRTEVDAAKSDYKNAKRAYSKAFDKAFNRGGSALSPFKRERDANDRRWQDVDKKAAQVRDAKAKYKQAKADQKARFKAEADAEWAEIEQYRRERKAKKAADKAKKSIEKAEYKAFIQEKTKEINAGESAVGRIYNKITGSDKLQAKIAYDLEKRHPNLD